MALRECSEFQLLEGRSALDTVDIRRGLRRDMSRLRVVSTNTALGYNI
jgi:hypothetical protein